MSVAVAVGEDLLAPPPRFVDASDRLHDVVSRLTGSSDFGGDEYRWGLRILLQAIDHDARFNEIGRRTAWARIVSLLSARVRGIQSLMQHPGTKALRIDRPIVITGVPRTGTTALHKLMSVDPQFQGLQTWLMTAPMPRPPRETWDSHPRFAEAVAEIEARYHLSPAARAAHNRVAEDVDECLFVLGQSFVSNFWASSWPLPTYDAWWQSQSERPAYAHLAAIIRLIGSSEPEKRWLLKNPGHIANLDLLFEIFPDALVIQTHRDPAKAIPSLTALISHYIDPLVDDDPALRRRILAHRETDKWAKAVRDCEAVRQTRPHQVIDVGQREFRTDPIGVMRRLYDFCGLELTAEIEAAMRLRLDDDPEGSHGTHRYDVADYGLTDDAIRDRFGEYVDRHDLRPKRSRR